MAAEPLGSNSAGLVIYSQASVNCSQDCTLYDTSFNPLQFSYNGGQHGIAFSDSRITSSSGMSVLIEYGGNYYPYDVARGNTWFNVNLYEITPVQPVSDVPISSVRLPNSVTHPVHDARIPAPTSSDKDKVLGVTNTSGALGWVEQSGGVTDVTVGGTSVVSGGVAIVPAIPSVAALTNNEIDTIWNTAMA